jgi:hypothetical protein
MSEGFNLANAEITDLKIESTYLMFRQGAGKKKYSVFYLSQDRWGTVHSGPGAIAAAGVGALGTASIFQAIRNFDNVLAMVKPPAPVVAPAPEPKPSAPPSPPAIVVASPPGASPNHTVQSDETPLVVRGVAMDGTGIPVVSINGSPANMRPQNTQAAEFWSEPLPLKAGDNPIQIIASNSAHVEANVAFTIHYTPKVAPVNPRSLDKAEIVSLLQGGVPEQRVVDIIKERGIKFTPTADDLNAVRAAGASEDLIHAIQQAAPPK